MNSSFLIDLRECSVDHKSDVVQSIYDANNNSCVVVNTLPNEHVSQPEEGLSSILYDHFNKHFQEAVEEEKDDKEPVKDPKNAFCDICDSYFSTKQSLKLHLESVHAGMRPYLCDECGKPFSQKSALSLHVKAIHRRLRPYICNECGLSFTQNGSLTNHIKAIHRGIYPFECGYCGRKYSTKSGLSKHVATVHEKTIPLKCEKCLEQFSDRTDLTNHMDLVHTEVKAFPCAECEKSFDLKSQLSYHVSRYHRSQPEPTKKKEPDLSELVLREYKCGRSISETVEAINKEFGEGAASRGKVAWWYVRLEKRYPRRSQAKHQRVGKRR